jgi:imidazolonepropionase-like amidohydrolase
MSEHAYDSCSPDGEHGSTPFTNTQPMRQIILLLLFAIPLQVMSQQDVAPVNGVSDRRAESYGFINARVVVDFQTTVENAGILISKGRIEAVGQNIVFPRGTIVYDLRGKTVYPSFVDVYSADYGVSLRSSSSEPGTGSQVDLTVQMRRQAGPSVAEQRIADYWNDGIHASYDVTNEFIPDQRTASEYRQAGFGAVVTFRAEGIARGISALVSTSDGKANNTVIKGKASANYSFIKGHSRDLYPVSQFGAIALLRQLNYDSQWYKQLPAGYFHDEGLEAYGANLSLPQIFGVSTKIEILRADRIGKEFGIHYIIKGAGDEYQTINDLKDAGNSLIVPVNFPEAPDVKDPWDAAAVSLAVLKHYELAPYNLSRLSGSCITFAITSSDLKRRTDFLPNLRKAVKCGLPENEALKALTATPAAMVGASELVGALRKNMIANLLITSGNIFSDDCVIYENWVQGVPYRFVDLRAADIRGKYDLVIDNARYRLVLSGAYDKPAVRLTADSVAISGASLTREKELVGISFERMKHRLRLSGYMAGNNMEGKGQYEDGRWFEWKAIYIGTAEAESPKKSEPAASEPGRVIYPFISYGWSEKPQQEDVLFRNATVWTNEEEGKMFNTDVLVQKGKIAAIGKNIRPAGAKVIDASGMNLTPGIIDEHSHIAIAGNVNESAQAVSSEVRVSDIINPEDPTIYRELAGGVTTCHVLHGSANPIGGQSVIIKNRWGCSARDLIVENQVGFLKHALGENVKQTFNRYPNSRMGTEQIIRDAYQRAADYSRKWKEWNGTKPAGRAGKVPPRRDLELDALVDVLERRSFITCHTYVQSEGTMIMNLAKELGLKVNTLIHFNEGYKIADQIVRYGAAASVFSDWWDYKYEVYEGINYNASLLLSQGVLTCLHSDDPEMGRRLTQEAAKTIKYGGTDEKDALKLVTLNPAKILHLDDRIGSIKTGKDADLVLWTGNPLSIYSRVSLTMVDGIIYFDEEQDAKMKEQIENERNRIIANILKESKGATTMSSSNTSR